MIMYMYTDIYQFNVLLIKMPFNAGLFTLEIFYVKFCLPAKYIFAMLA